LSSEWEYIKNRLDDQIRWYSSKATENKSRYYLFQIMLIVVTALIPIINVIDFAPIQTRVVSSILGGIALGVTSILQLKKHHENWIMYRSTEEALKKEKYTFENNAGAYAGLNTDKKRVMLVEKAESIISNQNVIFFVTHKGKADEKS